MLQRGADCVSQRGFEYSDSLKEVVKPCLDFRYVLEVRPSWVEHSTRGYFGDESIGYDKPSCCTFTIAELLEHGEAELRRRALCQTYSIGQLKEYKAVDDALARSHEPSGIDMERLRSVDLDGLCYSRDMHPEYLRDALRWRVQDCPSSFPGLLKEIASKKGVLNEELLGRVSSLSELYAEVEKEGGKFAKKMSEILMREP